MSIYGRVALIFVRQVKVAVGLAQVDVPKEVTILPNGKPTAVSASTYYRNSRPRKIIYILNHEI